jgi:CRISPR-associated protein Csa1
MFLLDEDESRYVIRGLAPRARREGVAEELRGWCWDGAPLAPLYEAPLTVADVADQRCPTGRDVYLRHVLGVEVTPDAAERLERALREATTALVIRAKAALYEHGALAVDRLSALPPAAVCDGDARTPDQDAAVRLLWRFEQRRIIARVEAALARQPAITADALVAAALPITAGRRLDGRYLGLTPTVEVDAVGFPEPVVGALRLGAPAGWHRVAVAGQALLLEALHETPVNLGTIAYLTLADGQLTLTRDLFVVDDELRQAFVDARDERARLVEEEVDPGLPPDCPASCPLLAHCRG